MQKTPKDLHMLADSQSLPNTTDHTPLSPAYCPEPYSKLKLQSSNSDSLFDTETSDTEEIKIENDEENENENH